jgi:hypothetical protein
MRVLCPAASSLWQAHAFVLQLRSSPLKTLETASFAMRILLFLIAISIVPSMLALNADIRCGKVTDFKKVEAGIVWDWKEEEGYGPEPFADGETFAIVTVKLKAKRSIGKYDYSLNGAKCLAMAKNKEPFRPDYWEQVHEADFDEIHLIFKVPDQDRYTFSYELTNREPRLYLPEGTTDAVAAAATPAPGAEGDAGGAKDILGNWECTNVEPPAEELAKMAVAAVTEKMGEGETNDAPDEVDGPVGQKWVISETEINIDGSAMPYKANGNTLSMAKPTEADLEEAGPMRPLVEIMMMFIPSQFTYTLDGEELKMVSNEIAGYDNKVVTFTLKRAAE